MAVVGITVTYNSAGEIRGLLDSVRGQVDELIIVDNASSDDVRSIADEYDFVRLLRNDENLGFARAVNRALAQVAGRNVLLLNPDVRCPGGAVDALMKVSTQFEDRFIVAPRLLYPDGRVQESVRSYPTLLRLLARRTAFGRTRRGAAIERRHVAQDMGTAPALADWVIGAVMYVPADVVKRIGLMDERFFLYCEDLDWCIRAWQIGSGVLFAPSVQMVHSYHRGSQHTWNLHDGATRLHWISILKLLAKYPALTLTGDVRRTSGLGQGVRDVRRYR